MHPNFVLLVSSIALMALAFPLAMKWVGPNPLYGIRLSKTLNNKHLWFKANTFGGWLLFGTALIGIALSLIAPLIDQFHPGLEWAVFVPILFVSLVATTVYAFRAA